MRLPLTTRMREILIETARAKGVPAHRLVSPGKEKPITRARRAWFHAMTMAGYSYSEIGQRAGFDHTSVLYGVREHSMAIYGTAKRAGRAEIEAAYAASQIEVAA